MLQEFLEHVAQAVARDVDLLGGSLTRRGKMFGLTEETFKFVNERRDKNVDLGSSPTTISAFAQSVGTTSENRNVTDRSAESKTPDKPGLETKQTSPASFKRLDAMATLPRGWRGVCVAAGTTGAIVADTAGTTR